MFHVLMFQILVYRLLVQYPFVVCIHYVWALPHGRVGIQSSHLLNPPLFVALSWHFPLQTDGATGPATGTTALQLNDLAEVH